MYKYITWNVDTRLAGWPSVFCLNSGQTANTHFIHCATSWSNYFSSTEVQSWISKRAHTHTQKGPARVSLLEMITPLTPYADQHRYRTRLPQKLIQISMNTFSPSKSMSGNATGSIWGYVKARASSEHVETHRSLWAIFFTGQRKPDKRVTSESFMQTCRFAAPLYLRSDDRWHTMSKII